MCDGNSDQCKPNIGKVGASCGTCQVCTEQGLCEFADGIGCGTCRVCHGATCGFAAQGTPCGGDGHECDGAGQCVCALQCGNRCCPSTAVDCCFDGFIGAGVGCAVGCTFAPPVGTYCPAEV
jgi:hypothetical protein